MRKVETLIEDNLLPNSALECGMRSAEHGSRKC